MSEIDFGAILVPFRTGFLRNLVAIKSREE
jgi:hypothetical protein